MATNLVPADDLAAVGDIADALGVGGTTVNMWAARAASNGFPAPVATLRAGRIWRLSEVRAWHVRRTAGRS